MRHRVLIVGLLTASPNVLAEQFLYLPTETPYAISCDYCCYRFISNGECHGGYDYRTPSGTAVLAAANGVVEKVIKNQPDYPRPRGGYGNHVVIRHNNDFLTTYAHLQQSDIFVVEGQIVHVGERIALSDNSGKSSGPHLHFEVRDPAGRRVDPYGENPVYPNCGANALWVTCPPTPYVPEEPEVDGDGDGVLVSAGDCDDANPEVFPAAAEVCNYIDDNCDGSIDEGFVGLLEPCVVGIGECENSGVNVCTADFATIACSVLSRPPSVELCDGLDNDCDGVIDNVVAAEICGNDTDDDCDGEVDEFSSVALQLTDSLRESELPSLVKTDDGFGVAWGDWRDGSGEIYFMLLDETGSPVGEEVALSASSYSISDPTLVWNGVDFGVFWSDNRALGNTEIVFTKVDVSGIEASEEIFLTDASDCSDKLAVAWTGDSYGLTWRDCRDGTEDIYFARLDEDGSKVGDDVLIYNGSLSRNPAIAWSGSEFGIVWECHPAEDQDLCFATVDVDGNIFDGPYTVTNVLGDSTNPAIVWSGDSYTVAWQDNRESVWNNEIYAIFLDSSGAIIGDEIMVSLGVNNSTFPAIAWNDEAVTTAIAWRDDRDGDGEIYFCTLDEEGAIGPEYILTDNSVTDAYPAVAADGNGFELVFSQSVGGANLELFSSQVLCVD